MKRLTIIPLILMLLVAGCATSGTSTKDLAIQYRSAFNALLTQFDTELSTMPIDQQKSWAQKSVPFISAGVLALQTMDMQIGASGEMSQQTLQAYLTAKNQMIDLVANLMLAKKGGK